MCLEGVKEGGEVTREDELYPSRAGLIPQYSPSARSHTT